MRETWKEDSEKIRSKKEHHSLTEKQYRNGGSLIRTLRKKANLSSRDLAEAMAVSTPTISNIENGVRRFSSKHLDVLSKILHISAEDLRLLQITYNHDVNSSEEVDMFGIYKRFIDLHVQKDAPASLTLEELQMLLGKEKYFLSAPEEKHYLVSYAAFALGNNRTSAEHAHASLELTQNSSTSFKKRVLEQLAAAAIKESAHLRLLNESKSMHYEIAKLLGMSHLQDLETKLQEERENMVQWAQKASTALHEAENPTSNTLVQEGIAYFHIGLGTVDRTTQRKAFEHALDMLNLAGNQAVAERIKEISISELQQFSFEVNSYKLRIKHLLGQVHSVMEDLKTIIAVAFDSTYGSDYVYQAASFLSQEHRFKEAAAHLLAAKKLSNSKEKSEYSMYEKMFSDTSFIPLLKFLIDGNPALGRILLPQRDNSIYSLLDEALQKISGKT